MTSFTCSWTVAHVLPSCTCDRAPCANGVAALCHGVPIMANDLVDSTSKGASGRRAPIVAIARVTVRWRVTHMLTSRASDWATSTLRMAAVCHGSRVMAQGLVHAAVQWARAH